MDRLVEDVGIVLRVKAWGHADKYVIVYTREHGKQRFLAFGARYPKNAKGRLLQAYARLELRLAPGERMAKLVDCRALAPAGERSVLELAYSGVMAEATALFTEDGSRQPELYARLDAALNLVRLRNPRVVALAYLLQLLTLTGFKPALDSCVRCGREASGKDAFFSAASGGLICSGCAAQEKHSGLEPFSAAARRLALDLSELDLTAPQALAITGGPLVAVESAVLAFLAHESGKTLKSLEFIAGITAQEAEKLPPRA